MIKTKNEQFEKAGIGVIVGRFQVPELTQGHKDLFESVMRRHVKVICVLGLAAIRATKNNPLDFESRRRMLEDDLRRLVTDLGVEIQYVYHENNHSNSIWSRKLDELISRNIPIGADVTLYGSRDSFLQAYDGNFKTAELVQECFTSGTSVRELSAMNTRNSKDWRMGAIWATANRFPTAYCAVDIAILDREKESILLARKDWETAYRFVGGFVDPKKTEGDFLIANAKREVAEETGLELGNYQYVTSMLTNDWRYRGEVDKIFSTLFVADYLFGSPKPMDDICELRWFKWDEIKAGSVELVKSHGEMLGHFILPGLCLCRNER